MSIEDQVRVLKARDVALWYELESNHMLGLVIEGLVAAFPTARFVMTVREPRSWLESQINQQYETGHIEPFKSADRRRYGQVPTTEFDEELVSLGLYGVGGYLSYWAAQNLRVINVVPAQNLKVVWTRDITTHASEVAHFLGVDRVDQSRTHGNHRSKKKLRLDDLIDASYLDEQLHRYTHDALQVIRSVANTSHSPQSSHRTKDAPGKRQSALNL